MEESVLHKSTLQQVTSTNCRQSNNNTPRALNKSRPVLEQPQNLEESTRVGQASRSRGFALQAARVWWELDSRGPGRRSLGQPGCWSVGRSLIKERAREGEPQILCTQVSQGLKFKSNQVSC